MNTKTFFVALFVFSNLSIVQSAEIEQSRMLRKQKSTSTKSSKTSKGGKSSKVTSKGSKSSKVSLKTSKGYKSPKLPSLEQDESFSLEPSVLPSAYPTYSSSTSPTVNASSVPSSAPSIKPSYSPTSFPTTNPSAYPTQSPSMIPTTSPTQFPSVSFDLQNCDSYSRRWLFDLESTCDPYYRTCQCTDAQRLINEGKIDCETAVCPEDCALCDFCLEDVIPNCISKRP